MKISPDRLGVQLYTVRSLCTTHAGAVRTLEALASMGYAAVDVACLSAIPDRELKQITRDLGLAICTINEDPLLTLAEPERVLERLFTLECERATYCFPLGFDLSIGDDVVKLTAELTRASRIFHDAGKRLCYHHHALEFTRYQGRTVLSHLLEHEECRDLSFVLDTYWIQNGGGSPAEWCRLARGRFPILHLKDYGVFGDRPTPVEIGAGNLDFPPILAAAVGSGCEWFVVEQDEPPGDPLDSLRQSHEYIAAHFLADRETNRSSQFFKDLPQS